MARRFAAWPRGRWLAALCAMLVFSSLLAVLGDLIGLFELPFSEGAASQGELPLSSKSSAGGGSGLRMNSTIGTVDGRSRGRHASPPPLTDAQRKLAAEIYADGRKHETRAVPGGARGAGTSGLPTGIPRSEIARIVKMNKRAVSLCIAKSMRKGERMQGAMELEVIIAPSGRVTRATVGTARFRGSALAACTIKRVRSWRFPRFEGAPATVILPFTVSSIR